MYIAYKYHTGKYSDCGPYFDQLVSISPKQPCIGIYYDDPKEASNNDLLIVYIYNMSTAFKVEAEKCRYIVGVVLSDEVVISDLTHTLTNKDYNFVYLPQISNAVQTYFPFRSVFSFLMGISGFLGAIKVYPALEKYCKVI